MKSEYIVLPILFVTMLVFGYSVLNLNNNTITASANAAES